MGLDEPGDVFREVLGRFGDEIAQVLHHLVADEVGAARIPRGFERDASGAVALAQGRVEAAPAAGRVADVEVEVEGHVVEAGRAVAQVADVEAEVAGEFGGGALHRVAEADLGDVGVARGQGPGVDRHRVDVVHQERAGAVGAHVLGECPEMRDGAQPSHDPADPKRVADGLAQAVAARHLEIRYGAGAVAADLEGGDDEIGAVECGAALAGRRDPGGGAEAGREGPGDGGAFGEARGVDVHQRDLGRGEGGAQQRVADKVLHEDGRAGPDEGDLGHLTAPSVRPAMKCFCIRKNISTGGRAAMMLPALIMW